jgi:pimeloyl-ACP methyl ester carboxylesterase
MVSGLASLLVGLPALVGAAQPAAGEEEGGFPPPYGAESTVFTAAGPVSAAAPAGQTFAYEDPDGSKVFRIGTGYDLDETLGLSQSPLDFSIDVGLNFGPVDSEGHPAAGNLLFGKAGRLTLRAYDVDENNGPDPEVDKLVINGTTLPGKLEGANEQWSINSFKIPFHLLRLPTPGNPSGRNDFQVLVDYTQTNNWVVRVDWAELRIPGAVRPLVMVKGINNRDSDFADMETSFQNRYPALIGKSQILTTTKRGTIETNAAMMEQPIADTLSATGSTKVNIMAHSMGGLAARRYAFLHPEKVAHVMMLGTPNGGSRLADIACFGMGGFASLVTSQVSKRVLQSQFGGCGKGDGLYQLRQSYVQDVFNRQIRDRNVPFATPPSFGTIAGGGNGIWSSLLDGEDDGFVTRSSVEYLRIGNSARRGIHQPVDWFIDVTHSGLLAGNGKASMAALCWMYQDAPTCTEEASEAQGFAAAAVPTPTGTPEFRPISGAAIPAAGSVSVPLEFESTSEATVLVVGGPGVSATIGGTTLAPVETLGSSEAQGATLASPSDGNLVLSNSSASEVEIAVIVSVSTERSLTVSSSAELVAPGQGLTLTAAVSQADAGDSVSAVVRDAAGAEFYSGPMAASNGAWTLALSPTTPGEYVADVTVGGSRPRHAAQIFTVSSGTSSIGTGPTVSLPDANANGMYDSLVASIPLTVGSAGSYSLAADLLNSAGTVISSAGTQTSLSAGSNSVPLSFPGPDIYRSASSGAYRIANVVLTRDDSNQIEAIRADAGQTQTLSYSAFDHAPVDIDRSAFHDVLVDTNGDGNEDVLRITGDVRAERATSYAVNARLTSNDVTVAEAQLTKSFVNGTNSFVLDFSWDAIRATGIDGPYTLEDLSIYPIDQANAIGYLTTAHVTDRYITNGGGRFQAGSNARILDTRASSATGVCPQRTGQSCSGAISGGQSLRLSVLGRGGIPTSGVSSVVLNLKALNPAGDGWGHVYPAGTARQTGSSINYRSGETVSNVVFAKVGADGNVDIYTSKTADYVVDIQGWFLDAGGAGGAAFTAVNPARLIDSRNQSPGLLAAGQTATITVAGLAGIPAGHTGAVALNVKAVEPHATGYFRVYPANESAPKGSALYFQQGENTSDAVVVKLSSDGKIKVTTTEASYLVIDVFGYFAGTEGDLFRAQVSQRILDTREPNSVLGEFVADTSYTLQIAGTGGVPEIGADAVVINIKAVSPGFGNFKAWDTGSPPSATVMATHGETVSATAIVRLAPDGTIKLRSAYAGTHVVVDVQGWFMKLL